MGFSVSSPTLENLQRRLDKADLPRLVYRAANVTALDHVVDPLYAAAKAAGASPELLSDIGVFVEDGEVVVGVPAGGPSSQEAFDLEYGTAVGAPSGWLRATIAKHRFEAEDAFSEELTKALFKGDA